MLTTFRTSGCAKGTHVNFVFLCHDSAKHASMMALAAPSGFYCFCFHQIKTFDL